VRNSTPERIERFCKTTRWFHWTFVASFLTLAATGGLLALREPLGLASLAREELASVHRAAAIALATLPVVVLLSGSTSAALGDLGEALRWTRSDLRWLALQPAAALGRAELPPAGKLNAGQKLNALATAGLAIGLGASGAWLWLRPGALLPWFAHVALFLLWLPAFAGHFFLAVVNPSTRPALRGMVLGSVDRRWATHHHEAWVAGLDRAARPPAPESEPAALTTPPRRIEAVAVDGRS
jgi:formate dehydrogenase subunit gamma